MFVRLDNGKQVLIRPIEAGDKDRLAAGHLALSDESRYRRYLTAKPRLTEAELRYLTEVDGHDHFALVAVLTEDPEQLVAVARFVRLRDRPDTAEFAIVVGDDCQGHGLGRVLAEALVAAARDLGIRRFTATVLSENVPAQRLIARMGRDLRYEGTSAGVRELVADIAA